MMSRRLSRSVSAALLAAVLANPVLAQTGSGLSGTPPLPPPAATLSGSRPVAPPPAVASGPARQPGASGPATAGAGTYRSLPSNDRLDVSSRRIDRQIKRGICVGC